MPKLLLIIKLEVDAFEVSLTYVPPVVPSFKSNSLRFVAPLTEPKTTTSLPPEPSINNHCPPVSSLIVDIDDGLSIPIPNLPLSSMCTTLVSHLN